VPGFVNVTASALARPLVAMSNTSVKKAFERLVAVALAATFGNAATSVFVLLIAVTTVALKSRVLTSARPKNTAL